jgi:hypothetical protein
MNKIILSALCLFTACAPVIKTEYVTVEVPVRCEMERPERPEKSDNPLTGLIDILAYTRKLEVTLDACTDTPARGGGNK